MKRLEEIKRKLYEANKQDGWKSDALQDIEDLVKCVEVIWEALDNINKDTWHVNRWARDKAGIVLAQVQEILNGD